MRESAIPASQLDASTPGVVLPKWTLWIIIGLILAPVLVMTRADPDLWGHVRFGLDMLADHTLPRVDPYSFTQDVPWMNHEWLSELLMGAAYRVGGPAGLVLLKGLLVTIFFAIVLSVYRGAPPLVGGAVLVLVAGGTGRLTTTLRPQLWSLIGVAVLSRFLINAPRQSWLVIVPLMFALWANLHGGWVVGAGILTIWTLVQLWRPQAPRALVMGVAVLSAVATLVNPYGWHLWGFLGATVRMARPISEWQPLLTTPVIAWIPWLAVVTGVTLLTVSRRRPPVDRIAIVAMLALASFRVERLAPLCVVSAVVLMSPTVLAQWPTLSRPFDVLSRRTAAVFALSIFGLALVSAAVIARTASCITIAGDWIPDRVAGRALVEGRAQGTIVTWFDWGEYAIWHLAPSLRVSLDGRRETIYSDAVLANHDAMAAATPEGIAYLQRLNPTYVWVPASLARLRDWLKTHGYRLDIQTAQSFVAVREDQPTLHASDATLSGCFPGP